MPAITGSIEINLTVSDPERSAAWYRELFAMDVRYDRSSDDGALRYICLVEPVSGLILALVGHSSNPGTPFDETHTGLDHFEFLVARREHLDEWAQRLDDLGIAHSGVKQLDYTPNSMVTFRDPDNIQLEFFWRAPKVAGASWAELVAGAPDVAAAGKRLLEDAPDTPGAAFLGTVGADGIPRVHPFIPAIVGNDLWAFVTDSSPKRRDLDRTGTFAIHSCLGDNDESFFCAGHAFRRDDAQLHARVAAAMPYTDVDEHHLLYEFRIVKTLWTTWTTPTSPVHRTWTYESEDGRRPHA